MLPEQARELLSAYREDLTETDAPGIAEALALTKEDPSLADWFQAEQAFDVAFAAALRDIPVAEDLHERLLHLPHANTNKPQKRFGVHQSLLWAAAATVILSVSLVKYFVFPPPVSFPGSDFASIDTFRDHMALFAKARFRLDYTPGDFVPIKNWLTEKHAPVYPSTPAVIRSYAALGCKEFHWGPHQVSLVCFEKENHEIVHIFVIERNAFKALQPSQPLNEAIVQHSLETGGWMDDKCVYLLVGSGPNVAISDILSKALTG